jgi:hypothetical protein
MWVERSVVALSEWPSSVPLSSASKCVRRVSANARAGYRGRPPRTSLITQTSPTLRAAACSRPSG